MLQTDNFVIMKMQMLCLSLAPVTLQESQDHSDRYETVVSAHTMQEGIWSINTPMKTAAKCFSHTNGNATYFPYK